MAKPLILVLARDPLAPSLDVAEDKEWHSSPKRQGQRVPTDVAILGSKAMQPAYLETSPGVLPSSMSALLKQRLMSRTTKALQRA